MLFVTTMPASADLRFSDRVEEYYLSNKLKVILIEDKRSPSVVSSIWYKVGSSYEYEGISGISHFLEHMMFKGTKTTEPGEFSAKIKKIGGTENAFTGRDFTGYFQKVHKSYLEICLKMEADRMKNLIFSQKEFKNEIEVVKEERRLRTDDNPTAKIFEKISNQAFGMRGYGVPIVGTMKDLNKISIADLKKWYLNYYVPNNAILILAGDFDKVEAKELIKKYYGVIEEAKVENYLEKSNHRVSFKSIKVEDKVSEPLVLMSFENMQFNEENRKENHVIELLMELMDGGISSRFTKNLIDDKKIAISTFISYDTYSRKRNLITIGGSPNKNISAEQLREALIAEFANLVEEGLYENELTDVKSRLLANNIYKFDSVFYQVMQIGMLETKNFDWNILDKYIHEINSITEHDLINAAKKYILEKDYIFSVIEPKKL
ncbi:MAG: insulinase family protein [Pelagibacterales bacterium]|nr:insulinase family protein [Pelagibacterales bacterium]